MAEEALGASAAELQQLLIETESFTDFLAEVCRYAANAIAPGCLAVSP